MHGDLAIVSLNELFNLCVNILEIILMDTR